MTGGAECNCVWCKRGYITQHACHHDCKACEQQVGRGAAGEEGDLQVWALSTDPVPGKDCQGHAEGAKAMSRQPGYKVQQLGLHAVAAARLYQRSCGLQIPEPSMQDTHFVRSAMQ